mmetsp:Transcript_4768/g.13035  ORF Transcript_4768/g.13035 Transcript_4768/m.13035 type:complete len:247 (+) Transcript_4768:608-1348(+)
MAGCGPPASAAACCACACSRSAACCCPYIARRSSTSARPQRPSKVPTSPATSMDSRVSNTPATRSACTRAHGRAASALATAERQFTANMCCDDGECAWVGGPEAGAPFWARVLAMPRAPRLLPLLLLVGGAAMACVLASMASKMGSSIAARTASKAPLLPCSCGAPSVPTPRSDSCTWMSSSIICTASEICGGTDRSAGAAGGCCTSFSPRTRRCSKKLRWAMSLQLRSARVSCASGPTIFWVRSK